MTTNPIKRIIHEHRLGPALLVMALLATSVRGQVEVEFPDERTERQVREAVERAELQQAATRMLIDATVSETALLRANAIEGLQLLPERALPAAQRGLGDDNPGVRFAAVVTAGRLELTSLVSDIQPLLEDDNRSVRGAAMFALHRLGEAVDLTPLAAMLRSDDPTLRANIAMLLGLLGDQSAVPMLKDAATAPMPRTSAQREAVVRTQVAEAIVRLGDNSELNTIRAGAYNQFGEVRVISIIAMGAVGDQRMLPALEAMAEGRPDGEPDEVRLAAAGSMARLGDEAALPVVLRYVDHQSPALRSQAAWALGWFSDPRAGRHLGKMLAEANPQVRVAAAAAALQHLDEAGDLN